MSEELKNEVKQSTPQEKHQHPKTTKTLEIMGFGVCLLLGVLFFVLRHCKWDIPALAVWAVVIVVFAGLLIRAEKRLVAAELAEIKVEDDEQ